MTIHTQQSLSGFIASQPQTRVNAKGETRFWVRIGQEHFERKEDGTFTQTETTYHDLVMFRANAERAYAMFNKGDGFIAEGYTHLPGERDGENVETEEFVAKKPRPRLRPHELHVTATPIAAAASEPDAPGPRPRPPANARRSDPWASEATMPMPTSPCISPATSEPRRRDGPG